jgi:uncharacterized protein
LLCLVISNRREKSFLVPTEDLSSRNENINMIADNKIKQAIDIIVNSTHPEYVILFGSYARGTATEQCDVDILVIEKSLTDKRSETVRIRRELSPLRIPVDIVVHSVEMLEECTWHTRKYYSEGRQGPF